MATLDDIEKSARNRLNQLAVDAERAPAPSAEKLRTPVATPGAESAELRQRLSGTGTGTPPATPTAPVAPATAPAAAAAPKVPAVPFGAPPANPNVASGVLSNEAVKLAAEQAAKPAPLPAAATPAVPAPGTGPAQTFNPKGPTPGQRIADFVRSEAGNGGTARPAVPTAAIPTGAAPTAAAPTAGVPPTTGAAATAAAAGVPPTQPVPPTAATPPAANPGKMGMVKGAVNAVGRGAARTLPVVGPALIEGGAVLQVAQDPLSTRTDVIDQAARSTGRAIFGALGATGGTMGGVALGATTGPGAMVASPALGLAGGVAGYKLGTEAFDYTLQKTSEAVNWARSQFGLGPRELPRAPILATQERQQVNVPGAAPAAPAPAVTASAPATPTPAVVPPGVRMTQAATQATQSPATPATPAPVAAGPTQDLRAQLLQQLEALERGQPNRVQGITGDLAKPETMQYSTADGRYFQKPVARTAEETDFLNRIRVTDATGPAGSVFERDGRRYENLRYGTDTNGLPVMRAVSLDNKGVGNREGVELIRRFEDIQKRTGPMAGPDAQAVGMYERSQDVRKLIEQLPGAPAPANAAPGTPGQSAGAGTGAGPGAALPANLTGNAARVAQAAQASGYDPRLALMKVGLESNFADNAKNPNSSAQGLGQLLKANRAKYGTEEQWKDPEFAMKSTMAFMADSDADLGKRLGRAPSPGEAYMGHLFGPQGAQAILSANPNAPIGKVVASYDAKNAEGVVKGNRLTGMNAGQVIDMIGGKVAKSMAKYGESPTADAAPAAAASNAGPAWADRANTVEIYRPGGVRTMAVPSASGGPMMEIDAAAFDAYKQAAAKNPQLAQRLRPGAGAMVADGQAIPPSIAAAGTAAVNEYITRVNEGKKDVVDPNSGKAALEAAKNNKPGPLKDEFMLVKTTDPKTLATTETPVDLAQLRGRQYPTPAPEDVAMLKKNRDASAFDQVYGPGAAARLMNTK